MIKQLFLILVLSGLLRFIFISSVPFSLNWDEASFGYSAYSLLLTGKDEYGDPFPLQFKSVGDYKCPMYIYLLVPVIKLFGLNEFAVRAVPSLLGTLTVPLFYILILSMINNRQIAFLSSLSLSLSPWHLQFTRAGADVAVSSFFVILGLVLFFRQKYLWSMAAFSAVMYSYFADRFFVPVLLLGLLTFFKLKIKHLLIFICLLFPLVLVLISSGHRSKILDTTLLSYHLPKGTIALIEYPRMFIDRYLSHFSPSFLFISGPEDNRQRISGQGMLYWTDLLLILLSIPVLKKLVHKNKPAFWFLLFWLAIGPLPAAITKDPVHARRAFNLVYPLSVLIGMGLYSLLRLRLVHRLIFVSLFIWCLGFYFLSYYIFTPRVTAVGSAGWQYGYKQLVDYVTPLQTQYPNIVIDTSYQGPYIFFLFFQQFPPRKYQSQARLILTGNSFLGEGAGYDNFVFRPIYWPNDSAIPKTLFAGPPERLPLKDILPQKARLIKTLYFPDGTEAWRLVETL